jgi:hypothetical protein
LAERSTWLGVTLKLNNPALALSTSCHSCYSQQHLHSLLMPSSSYAPLADELNPPFSKSTPAPIVTKLGAITYEQDERDLGEMPRRFSRIDKGKGKEKAWDEEQGQEYLEPVSSYPPVNNEDEDERRIQAVSCAAVPGILAHCPESVPPTGSRSSGKESTIISTLYSSPFNTSGIYARRLGQRKSECLQP